MRSTLVGLMVALSFANQVIPAVQPAQEARVPRIQAAILLDTSNSMDGLIDQARAQLWKMVNEFARARRDEKRATIEVALYEYGKSTVPEKQGHVRRIVPFTTDLDKISEELFSLKTNGGEEWCGRALAEASSGLEWSGEDADLKVAFIAGNEPFDQGPTDFRGAVKKLRKRGVKVVAIYCGEAAEGRSSKWSDGAALGGGPFLSIDPDKQAAHVESPMDAEIAKLGEELNATYVAYGADGRASAARQVAQDSNSRNIGHGSAVWRAQVKSSANYLNATWDLVDAVKGGAKVAEMKADDLPEALRAMNTAEREAYVAGRAAKREELQKKIAALSAAREKWIAEKTKAVANDSTLDGAMIAAVRTLGAAAGFHFE
jgi:hypothetical protein